MTFVSLRMSTIITCRILQRGRAILHRAPVHIRAATLTALASVVLSLAAGRIGAQTPDSSHFRCDGRTITAIEVNPQPPAIVGRDPSAFRRAVQHYLFQSGTTRERTVRSFILARVGQRCEDSQLPELARVVRAQPYLAA